MFKRLAVPSGAEYYSTPPVNPRKSSEALTAAHEAEHLSKTDVINRSLQLYHFLLEARMRGEQIATVKPDGTVMGLQLL